MLLPELAGFANLCLPVTKFGQSEHYLFRLQLLKPLVVDVAYPLVPEVDVRLGFCPLANIAVPPSVESRINILPSLRPCAITRPSSSMKHLRCVNRTSIPWSMICPTETRFFVIVGTCNTFMSFPFCPTWLKGTSPTFAIGCGVSSPSCDHSRLRWFFQVREPLLMARHMS